MTFTFLLHSTGMAPATAGVKQDPYLWDLAMEQLKTLACCGALWGTTQFLTCTTPVSIPFSAHYHGSKTFSKVFEQAVPCDFHLLGLDAHHEEIWQLDGSCSWLREVGKHPAGFSSLEGIRHVYGWCWGRLCCFGSRLALICCKKTAHKRVSKFKKHCQTCSAINSVPSLPCNSLLARLQVAVGLQSAVEFCHVAIATGLKAQHQSMLRRLLGTDRS